MKGLPSKDHGLSVLLIVDTLLLELTYPIKNHFWDDDFPFPKVGYVSSLEDIYIQLVKQQDAQPTASLEQLSRHESLW